VFCDELVLSDWLEFSEEFVVWFTNCVVLVPIEEFELLVVLVAEINWEELVELAFGWVLLVLLFGMLELGFWLEF